MEPVSARYDISEHLGTPEEMAAYLEACLGEVDGDGAFIAEVPGDIARAKGMAQVARDAGLSCESLNKALSGERTAYFGGLNTSTATNIAGSLPSFRHQCVVLLSARTASPSP